MAQIINFRIFQASRLFSDSLLQMENVQNGVQKMVENVDALQDHIKTTQHCLSGLQDELQVIQDDCQRSVDFNRRCQHVLEQKNMDDMVRLRDRCLKKRKCGFS